MPLQFFQHEASVRRVLIEQLAHRALKSCRRLFNYSSNLVLLPEKNKGRRKFNFIGGRKAQGIVFRKIQRHHLYVRLRKTYRL